MLFFTIYRYLSMCYFNFAFAHRYGTAYVENPTEEMCLEAMYQFLIGTVQQAYPDRYTPFKKIKAYQFLIGTVQLNAIHEAIQYVEAFMVSIPHRYGTALNGNC